ncbi:MAG: hypothetical protein IPM35_02490 [Myxococcales bacterium]|nr:hypothetical protein [Myxococcales bacterium]
MKKSLLLADHSGWHRLSGLAEALFLLSFGGVAFILSLRLYAPVGSAQIAVFTGAVVAGIACGFRLGGFVLGSSLALVAVFAGALDGHPWPTIAVLGIASGGLFGAFVRRVFDLRRPPVTRLAGRVAAIQRVALFTLGTMACIVLASGRVLPPKLLLAAGAAAVLLPFLVSGRKPTVT